MTKLDRLTASHLGSVVESLSWSLSMVLKRCLSHPLMLGREQENDIGWKTRCWMVRSIVRSLRHIVRCMRRGLVVSNFQLIQLVLQHPHLNLCCCCTICILNNQFCNEKFVHCGFGGIELLSVSFLAQGRTYSFC